MKPPPCPVCYLINCDCDRRKKEFIQERIADALERIADALELQNYGKTPMTPINNTYSVCTNHGMKDTGGICINCGEA